MTRSGRATRAPVPRLRPGNYPAILSYGFRPFFLLGALYAALAMLAWIPVMRGSLATGSLWAPIDWHIHEMLFGYAAAIVAGFLLTAIPNWTGRLPVQGARLLALVLLWIAGRVAVFFSAAIGPLAAALIDCAFLTMLAAATALEICAGRNWRNLKVLVPLVLLLVANILFHGEAARSGASEFGRGLAIAAIVLLIMLIGGRIVPSFTRNWLARENPGRLPAPFNRFDMAAILVAATALAAWIAAPGAVATGWLLLLAALAHLLRLARWAGDRALRDPLVLILHVAYLFVPIGLALAGLAALRPAEVPAVAGVHVLGVGAMGVMTLAVMTRATLGHTGRVLRADGWTSFIYLLIVAATLARLAAAFLSGATGLLHLSALLWAMAFLGFALRYGGMLLRLRLERA